MNRLKETNAIDINYKPSESEHYDVMTQCNVQKEFAESDSDDDLEHTIERKDSISHQSFRKVFG